MSIAKCVGAVRCVAWLQGRSRMCVVNMVIYSLTPSLKDILYPCAGIRPTELISCTSPAHMFCLGSRCKQH